PSAGTADKQAPPPAPEKEPAEPAAAAEPPAEEPAKPAKPAQSKPRTKRGKAPMPSWEDVLLGVRSSGH
ncbi:septation protein SepH, partial [Nocardia puris]